MADNNERQEDDHQDKLNLQVPDQENHGDQQEDNSATANPTRLDSEMKKKTKIMLKNRRLPPYPPLTLEAGGHGRQEITSSSSAGNIPSMIPAFDAFNSPLAGGSTNSDLLQYNLQDQLRLLQQHSGNLKITLNPLLNSPNEKQKDKVVKQQPLKKDMKKKKLRLKKYVLRAIPMPPLFGGPSSVVCFICNQEIPPAPPSLIWSPLTLRCRHTFCIECIQEYARIRIVEEENLGWFKCPVPKCPTMIRPATFMEGILPDEVVERWVRIVQEAKALANPMIVCPFRGCGRMFLDDKRMFLIRACPHCWGVFCMQCRVSWHLGVTCKEFVRLVLDNYERNPPFPPADFR